MIYRTATTEDIPAMHGLRMSVKENVLVTPGLVTPEHYRQMITQKGKGWVCEENGTITGFAFIDAEQGNVWALFVQPGHEGKGIGRELHNSMLQWAKEQNIKSLWLSTDPGTRAEKFYRRAGWVETGMMGNELRFEYSF